MRKYIFNSSSLVFNNIYKFSTWPKFSLQKLSNIKNIVRVIHSQQCKQIIPQKKQQQFNKQHKIVIQKQEIKQVYLSQKIMQKYDSKLNIGFALQNQTHVQFTQKVSNYKNFSGLASHILSSGYKFSRKKQQKSISHISIGQFKNKQYILELVNARLKSKQWANTRADEANPEFFLKQAQAIFLKSKLKYADKVKMTVIKGHQLLDQGFRLMHAVGRASINQPIFINLSFNNNPQTDQYHSFVGKGVCFDSGGLNLKPTAGIKQMHMDKHGATSVLTAFQSIVNLNLKVNLTVSIGLVQNFVSNNSYRPLDIIKSRKGLTVQIGNTDAQGRLVLADCMNWTQEKFKVVHLIELSTLTGAIVVALGKKHAGLFTNSDSLSQLLIKSGQTTYQKLWRMPLDSYHHQIIKPKTADITNSAGKGDAASSQAAAFLQNFVQKNVKWAHIDIAGTNNVDSDATGYGSRLLIQYIKNLC